MPTTFVEFEKFWNVGVFARVFGVSFKGVKRGIDLDSCNKSWAASVSSFVRIRWVGSLVDVVAEDVGAQIEEDVGGWG